MKIVGLILCEGNTDQILIGSYLESVSFWTYCKSIKNNPFVKENINWYTNDQGEFFGIWDNGGDVFDSTLVKICTREKSEHIIDNILVITDNDDDEAGSTRPQKILEVLTDNLRIEDNQTIVVNGWKTIEYESGFGKVSCRIGYMLVPLNEQGALETFMLKALSENCIDNEKTIEQVDSFIEGYKSDVYLKSRRERVKARMGISLSIFAPDRSFCIMKEIIDSVDWGKFKTSLEQFELLNELLEV